MNQKWIKLMNKPTLDANDYTWINLDTIRKVKVEKGDIVTSEKTVKGKRTPSAQSKTKRQLMRPQKKQIRFTVGAGAGQTEQ